ncbi:MAG: hypothetical protein ACXAC8_11730 [Candidatus Hodarchaeales archaeon]|jgi:hypothetical protein
MSDENNPELPENDTSKWDNENNTGPKLKNITIRGINSNIYEDFSQSMKMLNMTIGDAVSKMMRDVMIDLDETFTDFDLRSPLSSTKKLFGRIEKVSINHHDKLEISAKDLLEADASISFSHIDKLIIRPDVTRELFNKHIRSISHCDTVRLPSILPKLLLLSRINFCDKVEVYPVNQLSKSDNDVES